eukprot:Protomagalhaensia_sp_Gyna_25__1026@NODE_1497_length_1786_cov_10_362908_g1212_i0_p1_GENE_NODE_1497_length_1786_cov_10_362908_g1212_i0NODE_1497_length_1786_cov_10_362908_g1212_i0_p1_ORF_typecomplete_len481_score69_27TPT/PF03151_16/1_3e56UAA/PF08449_11/47UAA/PF08449_11/1_5e17EamA/PF00892_20/0_0025EamA/PF00892_20/1_1e07PUNUT/PF16913_5/2_8e09Nuc_sug_transp/PF04142_15/1_1e02Nuc_sug_transp/PF04142_15/1_8e06Nuc_sug_transp/PF04142_15/0_029SLC35F/PF06027_12/3e02SLC35F/PF06027_12/1_8e07CRTlike/PF08627_10/0
MAFGDRATISVTTGREASSASIMIEENGGSGARSAPATRVPTNSELLLASSNKSSVSSSSAASSNAVREAESLGEWVGEYGLLIFAILAYSCTSLAVVYYNWWLFTSGFKYPVFVSWIQQVVGFCIFFLGSRAALYFSSLRPLFPHADFNLATLWKIAPLSVSFVLTIGLANICLQKTLISTYQVARSLTLLFVILLSYLLLKQKQGLTVLFACGLMVIGFMIGSLDPETLSLGGLIAGGFSSFFQSLYNVLIAKTMPLVQGDNQLLLFYNVTLSSLFFIPMTLLSEDMSAWQTAFGQVADTNLWVVWGGMALSGILGTTLNMTQYLVVKVTSPLTFNIVGFSKSLVQSVGGIVFFGDKVSLESASGLLLCLFGSGLYAKAKHTSAKKAKKAAAEEEHPSEKEELLELDGKLKSPSSPSGESLKARGGAALSFAGTAGSASTADPSPAGMSPDLIGNRTAIPIHAGDR